MVCIVLVTFTSYQADSSTGLQTEPSMNSETNMVSTACSSEGAPCGNDTCSTWLPGAHHYSRSWENGEGTCPPFLHSRHFLPRQKSEAGHLANCPCRLFKDSSLLGSLGWPSTSWELRLKTGAARHTCFCSLWVSLFTQCVGDSSLSSAPDPGLGAQHDPPSR